MALAKVLGANSVLSLGGENENLARRHEYPHPATGEPGSLERARTLQRVFAFRTARHLPDPGPPGMAFSACGTIVALE